MRTDAADLNHQNDRRTSRLLIFAVAAAFGVVVASLVPQLSEAVRTAVGFVSGTHDTMLSGQEAASGAEQRKRDAASSDEQLAIIKLTDAQIEAAGIELAPVQGGTLAHRIIVPGTIVPNANRIARVSVKLSATVAELRKNLGDTVIEG